MTSSSQRPVDSSHADGQTPQWRAWAGYTDRRAIAMLLLGFAAGIPILLIFSSLSLWLTEAGVDRATVTMFSWAALGYSFKFIWAPLIAAVAHAPFRAATRLAAAGAGADYRRDFGDGRAQSGQCGGVAVDGGSGGVARLFFGHARCGD